MGEPSPGIPPSNRTPAERLDSWKEIAAYLKRDVTTAQRWEKREGMPVHRHVHDRLGSVYALTPELDTWLQSRRLSIDEDEKQPEAETSAIAEGNQGRRGAAQAYRWLALAVAAAINKLREALRDSADNPRFIETLPRRGYRFVAPVSKNDLEKATSSDAGRKIAVLAAVAVLLIVVLGGAFLRRSRRKPVLSEKDSIVLGDFANSTGDLVFDGTLREGLSVLLQESPLLSLVSEERIQQTLQMMGQPANVRLTPQIAREVCQRTNGTAALDGSIALIGTRYDLILRAVNCANGDLLASTEAQANDKSHVLDALSKAASDIRTKLGESLSTVQKYNTPLEQATTPSLEALQTYSLGWRTLNEDGDSAVALSFWQRAVQRDPNFAAAYDAMKPNIVGPYAPRTSWTICCGRSRGKQSNR